MSTTTTTIAVFNNKGGVGKSTLTYHLGCALAESGCKTLLVDLDPQSNLTLYGLSEDRLHNVWEEEERFIDDFAKARDDMQPSKFEIFSQAPRSIHFILKPTEDGTAEATQLPSPVELSPNLGLIPGRLSIHMFEDRIASRWSQAFLGDPLAVRTLSRIYKVCQDYGRVHGFKVVLLDTSPSLGILNKVIISTSSGFLVPCAPDMFSLYGIRNIGRALAAWKTEFDTLYTLLSQHKRDSFPKSPVEFIGYTIYNARKRTGTNNPWNLATAHANYASQIPETIRKYIPATTLQHLTTEQISKPIGNLSVMHSHNTLPAMAQKYRLPIWKVPSSGDLRGRDRETISGNRGAYESTCEAYRTFAQDVLQRVGLST